jgi:sterol desaturase/sphingolipid hydroxylase (fatty acid hydroxylase superfamily)
MDAAIGLLAGIASWTLLEYVIHYPLGHLTRGRTTISSEHLKHHRDILYFTPLPMKVRGAVPFLAVLGALAVWLAGWPFALGYVAAVAAGWTTYELVHQSIHVHGPTNPYTRWAARHHLHHHFVAPRRNHGVTTPLWDWILRTGEPARKVPVRRRDLPAVPWLTRALSEATPPEFLADYEIV